MKRNGDVDQDQTQGAPAAAFREAARSAIAAPGYGSLDHLQRVSGGRSQRRQSPPRSGVRFSGELSDSAAYDSGLPQGSCLSPVLFSLSCAPPLRSLP